MGTVSQQLLGSAAELAIRCHLTKYVAYSLIVRLRRNYPAMPAPSIDTHSTEILLDVFRQCLSNSGLIDAVSYRAEHEDWIENLNELQQRQLLMREGYCYRISFGALTLLNDEDVVTERNRCESVFNVLRRHYKNPDTRNQEKLLKDISEELGLTYEQIRQTMRYFMDASPLWRGGSSNNFDDPKSAYVKPTESIITCKNFEDLVAKVQNWFRPNPLQFSPFVEIPAPLSEYDSVGPQQMGSDLHPGPIVTSYLYGMDSDTVVRIVGRVGLIVNWSLTKEQAYSEKTRRRAYIPRIEAALQTLSERDRLLVARNITHELSRESPETMEPLNSGLGNIGWQIIDGELTPHDLDVREAFFPSGAEHTAYVQIRSILRLAQQCIDIVDPYLDGSIFTMLKALSGGASRVRLLTASPPNDFKLEASKFQKEAPNISLDIRANRDFHDRFIVLDDARCFHVGASIKDAGKRACMISQLEDRTIAASLIAYTKEKWEQATPL